MTATADKTSYAMSRHLDLPYAEAREKIESALSEEGFGILTEIDVKATMKKKLDVDFRHYVILGACNPHLAHRALSTEIDVGLLLPCNVVVYEDGDGSTVAIADPDAILGVGASDDLQPVAAEARERLERALAAMA